MFLSGAPSGTSIAVTRFGNLYSGCDSAVFVISSLVHYITSRLFFSATSKNEPLPQLRCVVPFLRQKKNNLRQRPQRHCFSFAVCGSILSLIHLVTIPHQAARISYVLLLLPSLSFQRCLQRLLSAAQHLALPVAPVCPYLT